MEAAGHMEAGAPPGRASFPETSESGKQLEISVSVSRFSASLSFPQSHKPYYRRRKPLSLPSARGPSKLRIPSPLTRIQGRGGGWEKAAIPVHRRSLPRVGLACSLFLATPGCPAAATRSDYLPPLTDPGWVADIPLTWK